MQRRSGLPPALIQFIGRSPVCYYADLDADELADGLWRNYNNTLPDFHLPLRTRDFFRKNTFRCCHTT